MLARRAVDLRTSRLAIVVAVGLACLWLLASREPTYDPWAWLVWGRQIGHGTLDTVAGPSWKPFPVAFTTVFSFFGDDAAPILWLIVARVGFLLALCYAYRVATGVAGPVAGVLAAFGVALIDNYFSLSARGNSEGLMICFSLAAVERHRAGRYGQVLWLGVAAGLLRPEMWPFFGLYALWWAWIEGGAGARVRRLAMVGVVSLGVLVAWFVPEKIGSGSLLRGASRAREPVAGSPGQSAHPLLTTFTNAAGAVDPVFYVGGFVAVALAGGWWWQRRNGRAEDDEGRSLLVLALAAIATAYMVIVAILAQAGFTGNERYVSLPAALVCVLGGIGIVQGVRWVAARAGGARWPAALAGAAVVALSVTPVIGLADDARATVDQGHLYDHVSGVIARAGGAKGLQRCGPVFTGPFETQLLAYKLDLHADQIHINPRPPGSTLAVAGSVKLDPEVFRERFRQGGWVVRDAC